MEKQDFSKMTEDELFEHHFDKAMGIASIVRCIESHKEELAKLAKEMDEIELVMESRETLKENAIN